MKVTCNKCENEFFPLLKEQDKQVSNKTIIRTYFECPQCGEQYNVCYDDAMTLGLKKQIRKCTAQLSFLRGKEYERELSKIKKKQKRLQIKQQWLETEFLEAKQEKEI